MVNHGEMQPREPKVLRVRVVVPTAAVATFSTLTLAGVAALGFASGSLDGEVPTRNADWAVNSPGSVRVLGPITTAAGATPESVPLSMDAAAGRDAAALDPDNDPVVPRAGSAVAPANQARQVSPGVGASPSASRSASRPANRPATPAKNLSSITHRAPTDKALVPAKAPSNMLKITLPARVLLQARQSVAAGLKMGLIRELDAQDTLSLEAELKSSTKLDDAVAKATGDAAQQGILAAQAASGPKAAPSVVSQVAEQTFRAELPRQLTMTVQPVVLNVLGDLSSEVSAAALSSALDTAATDAAAQVCEQVAEHVGDRVAVLVETTASPGVPAPTATVSTAPVPEVTLETTDASTPSPTFDHETDRPHDPVPSTSTEPTSVPTTEPGRGAEPSQTSADPGTDRTTEPTSETRTDDGTDRRTEPTSETSTDSRTSTDTGTSTRTVTRTETETSAETGPDSASRGAGPASEPTDNRRNPEHSSDPTSPTSVTTSATTSITVTGPDTAGSDR